MQAYQSDFIKTFQLIYQRHGFLGLYSGFIVNSLRVAAKQLYRWPLQIGLFGFYRQIFNQKISRGTLGVICGINMALIQVGILCPFERMKVWLMTSSKHAKMRDFFQKLSFKALFDGVVPIFYKQLISWVTFLGATQFFKDIAYKYQNKDRFSEQLNHKQIMVVTGCVAIVNTFFVMPADCIKTHFQKNQNSDENFSLMKKSHKFRSIVGQIYLKYGVKGFFKGWQIKLAQYTVNSLLQWQYSRRFQNSTKRKQSTKETKTKSFDWDQVKFFIYLILLYSIFFKINQNHAQIDKIQKIGMLLNIFNKYCSIKCQTSYKLSVQKLFFLRIFSIYTNTHYIDVLTVTL